MNDETAETADRDTTTDPIADLVRVLDEVERLVAAVADDQWHSPTPCPEWDVRELVTHLVLGDRLYADILDGEATATPDALDPKTADPLGPDPATAFRQSAGRLVTVLQRPGLLEETFAFPVGIVPGVAGVQLCTTENLVHGLDLARALGERPPFPEPVAERVLTFSAAKLADVPPEHSPFAPPQPVPDDAPAIVRLAALLGRPVTRSG